MYRPTAFREDDPAVCKALIRNRPLASLLWVEDGVVTAEHAPLELSGDDGLLYGHLARTNPLAQARPTQLTALFRGADAYISPSWYPSKAEHGKVVPTWNYSAVEAIGRVTWINDPDQLRGIVEQLTNRHETLVGSDWRIDDAPGDFVQTMLANIVGFELHIETLRGKFKLSQNRSEADRAGALASLRDADPSPESTPWPVDAG